MAKKYKIIIASVLISLLTIFSSAVIYNKINTNQTAMALPYDNELNYLLNLKPSQLKEALKQTIKNLKPEYEGDWECVSKAISRLIKLKYEDMEEENNGETLESDHKYKISLKIMEALNKELKLANNDFSKITNLEPLYDMIDSMEEVSPFIAVLDTFNEDNNKYFVRLVALAADKLNFTVKE